MSYRKARLSHVIRDVVSDMIANRLSDPRISRFTSVTRVELSPDSRYADVHVSIMGTPAEASKTMQGLASAKGMIQARLARDLDIRHCPSLRFRQDQGIKIAIDTYQRMQDAKEDETDEAGYDDSDFETGDEEKDSDSDNSKDQG